jgi:hypothetical protein
VVLVRRSERWASVMEKVSLVEDLFDRGVLDEGRRVSKQPGRCCATGCEVPNSLMKPSIKPLSRRHRNSRSSQSLDAQDDLKKRHSRTTPGRKREQPLSRDLCVAYG